MPTTKGDQVVQVQKECYWRDGGNPSHQFVVVSSVCTGQNPAQPILIKELNERKGWVLNRFGELYPATVNIELMDVYKPPC